MEPKRVELRAEPSETKLDCFFIFDANDRAVASVVKKPTLRRSKIYLTSGIYWGDELPLLRAVLDEAERLLGEGG